ncbi:diacylglycerol kinase [Antrihabitans sp. YC2-6]|uniref:diacylglycerol kinase n=1 Tax=Antrihabitans sp. YC2-6 TaxID=2799498 RepID=UPI0018F4DFE9|nr:diacylglycerol kinase [Antrihabitans sp. YC2-6]MBJ8346796.1 diacylglycerol kinase [Antrihabitans sp. YC2-6]
MSAISSVAVLTNPMSGHGKAMVSSTKALGRLRERGVDVVELQGATAAESLALARQAVADGVDALVAAGGDGLISCVLQAVATSNVPLGIIPGGTGNDLAREFGIPVDDPVAAADIVIDGTTKTIDLGRVGDRWFGTVLSSGFDSRVTDRANLLRWPKGPMRYNVAMIAELAKLEAVPYRIELDDRTVEVDAILVTVGNTRSYGGGMLVVPTARPDDGMLDITVVGATSRFRLIRLFPTIYKGTHVDIDGVDVYRSARVRLSAPDTTAYADGEPLGSLPIDISADPGVLQLRCP